MDLFGNKINENTVIFETLTKNEEGKNYIFRNPKYIIEAFSLEEVEKTMRLIQEGVSKGYYAAGYMTYEAGFAFEDKLKRKYGGKNWRNPLIWFGMYEEKEKSLYLEPKVEGSYRIDNFKFNEKIDDYIEKIHEIKGHIKQGDTYQINFTGKIDFEFEGDPFLLYSKIKRKQSAGYTAFIKNKYGSFLSFSPEMFFKKTGDIIISKPMKGTAARGKNIEDDNNIVKNLKKSEKNCAENIMIVDLIRNDIGKISEIGSVCVTKLFEVEKYETVFQMTSTIEARLKKDIGYLEIFKALFPCGSITGAPKFSSMEIINQLEKSERGIYTGTIGYIEPNNDGVFNIAIRTVEINDDKKGLMGVGSGIVWDSDAFEEYEECLLKSKFLTDNMEEINLIESLYLYKGKYRFLERHIRRMENASDYFCFKFSKTEFKKMLEENIGKTEKNNKYKVRMSLVKDGKMILNNEIIDKKIKKQSLKIVVADKKTDSDNKYLYFKTNKRDIYNSVFSDIQKKGYDEAIFVNEKEEVTECCNNNIIIKKDGKYYTPPSECGLLKGTMIENLLEKMDSLSERIITLEELKNADKVYICNSVRGVREATIVF